MTLDFRGTLQAVKSKVTFNQVLENYGFKTGPGMICCPLHSESTGSFKIYEGDTGEGNFWCFGCQKGGDMVTFVSLYEGITAGQALNRLIQKFNIDVKTREYHDHVSETVAGLLKVKEPKTPKACAELRVALACAREFEMLLSADITPYMSRKQIRHFGTKSNGNTLVIPAMDLEENLWNLQYIYPDGTKMFRRDGRRVGCMHRIGPDEYSKGIAYLAEGYATGASIFQATGVTTFISFTSSNLDLVYTGLREKYDGLKVIIAGDNDKAGRKHSAPVIYPGIAGKDWNDVYVEEGEASVKMAFDSLIPVRGNPLVDEVSAKLGRL